MNGEATVADAFHAAGAFRASLETVRAVLCDFPAIEYHPGWIPATFVGLAERRYKFVHVDVDLYEPTKAAIAYFYPRLVGGGAIVIDEYGLLRWPGARRAVEEFCLDRGILAPIPLTSGNAVLIKK